MSRVFLSHSSLDDVQAVALKQWLVEQDPGLAEEIFLDLDRDTGIAPGERWKDALRRANERCEAVICLLSTHWEASRECRAEYRAAETLGKLILGARLEPLEDEGITGEWQRCDLFGHGPFTEIEVEVDGQHSIVVFITEGLQRLHQGLRRAGIGAEHFPWPPPNDPDRDPYRGWEPLEEADAAVFFGRDGQIVAALDELRGMRHTGVKSLFLILGPSGAGKSSFLRAGLLPRLRRDDRQFLVADIVRPARDVLTGDRGLARAVHALLAGLRPARPTLADVKAACISGDTTRLQGWLTVARHRAKSRLTDSATEAPAPTVVLPLDQTEELFSADAGPEAPRFLELLPQLLQDQGTTPALIVAGTIRADSYEAFQTTPELTGLTSVVFGQLKPMAPARFTEVILGPAARASAAGRPLSVKPALVDRLLEESAQGADTLPLLALTLARLYRDYGGDGDLTLAEYEAMGGMRQIVHREIDTLLSRDPDVRNQQLDLLHAAFIPWLATINPDTDQPARRIARLSDLPTESLPLIGAMVDRRLLVRGHRGSESVIEVALESLLRQWPELAGWLDAEREDLKEADSLERAAAAWKINYRNDAWLLEGQRLAGAERLAQKPGFRDRLEQVREFLRASRGREEQRGAAENARREAELQAARDKQEAAEAHAADLRKRSRILKLVLASAIVIAMLAVAGFVRASFAQREATERSREATALRLVSEAQSMFARARPGGDARALKQVLAAHGIAPTAEGENALLKTVVAQRSLKRIVETESIIGSVSISPDGQRVAFGALEGTIGLWDGTAVTPLNDPTAKQGDEAGFENEVRSVAFSPDGRTIATGGMDGTMRRWDGITGKPIGGPVTGDPEGVSAVAFSPDGRMIAAGGMLGTLHRWNAKTGKPIGNPILMNEGTVSNVAFSPDSRTVLAAAADSVRRWDAGSGRPIGEPITGPPETMFEVAFSPDGRMIAAGGFDGTVRRWDAGSGKPIGKTMTGHQGAVNSMAFSPDGQTVASGSEDGTVRLWDADTGRPAGEMSGDGSQVLSLVFSPDGHQVVSAGEDGTIRWWDANPDRPSTVSTIELEGQGGEVAFSPDGLMIATGDFDGMMRRFDVLTGDRIGDPITTDQDGVIDVVFSPDGQMLASGGADGSLRRWNVVTGDPIGSPMTGHHNWVIAAEYSPDGQMIASGDIDGVIRRWNAVTGDPIGSPMTGHGNWARVVVFSPDGQTIVSGSDDGTLRRWNAGNGKPIGDPITAHQDGVASVAFSPDGSQVITGGADSMLRRWDVGNGKPIGEPVRAHQGGVASVAFSPDGSQVITGGADGTVRRWDAGTGEPIGYPITGQGDWLRSVTFSRDGRLITVVADEGTTVRRWPVPEAWPAELCAKLTQNISHEQWLEWVSPDIQHMEICPRLPVPLDVPAIPSPGQQSKNLPD